MARVPVGKIVHYCENNHAFAALVTHSEDTDDALAYLTIFGITGQDYRKAAHSKELKHGHWSWIPQGEKK